MHEPRLLGIPGEDLPNVSHYFDEPHKYFGNKLLVVGGKNSAVEAALRCYHCGADVTISYRGQKFNPETVKRWILPEMESLIDRKEIKFFPNTTPVELKRREVILKDNITDDIIKIETDFVLLLTGYKADMSLFRQAGISLSDDGDKPGFNENTMETNVPGLYVAGTATAGTQQSFKVFIENCHIHVERIAASILGKRPPADSGFDHLEKRPES
jgi:thioredoxin reductase (NADPH)